MKVVVELQILETIKLYGSTKKLIEKSLEVFEGVDNHYQQKYEVLNTFTLNKSCAYLSNVEPSNLVFLKTSYTEFEEIIKIFTDQNRRLLEIEDKVNQINFIVY